MGWSGGSAVFDSIISSVEDNIDDEKVKQKLYKDFIEAFEDGADCDTLYECKGQSKAFDKVWKKLYPDDEEE